MFIDTFETNNAHAIYEPRAGVLVGDSPKVEEVQIFEDPAFESEVPFKLDAKDFFTDYEDRKAALEAEHAHIRANGGKLCHISKPCGICQSWYAAYREEREIEQSLERM